MSFWDASALVPLLIDEPRTKEMIEIKELDRDVVVWWTTQVECTSALARRERANSLAPKAAAAAFDNLRSLATAWYQVPPTDRVRDLAVRLLRTHTLAAADALQLAAALVASEEEPATLGFVCLGDRLALAARREGFTVAP